MQRYQFQDARFYGLESLTLNNLSSDCSGVREALAYYAFEVADLPTSRSGYAQLFINDADYGLMLVLETQDDRWLDRSYAEDDGNFYDGSYLWAGFFPASLDFGLDKDEWFDLEEGEDIGAADIGAVSQGVKEALLSGQIDLDLAELLAESELSALNIDSLEHSQALFDLTDTTDRANHSVNFQVDLGCLYSDHRSGHCE